MEQTARRSSLRARLERAGLTRRQERRFNIAAGVFLCFYLGVWTYTIVRSYSRGEGGPLVSGGLGTSPLAPGAAPATYLFDAALGRFAKESSYRGYSGAINVVIKNAGEAIDLPDSLPAGAKVMYAPVQAPASAPAAPEPQGAGLWKVVVQMGDVARAVPGLSVITTVPMSEKRAGRIGQYLVGSWPFEKGGARSAAYTAPRGFVRVMPEDLGLPISTHITLGDYLTKGQANVWPKYVALVPRALDKVELTLQELERGGHKVSNIGVISAFRTPSYNAGGGNTAGRGALSRHMYGDAIDFYIDNDRNGRMDDLNGDGRVDKNDARVIGSAAERVERQYPAMVGGIGIYAPTGGHSGFVHLDTRGSRARW